MSKLQSILAVAGSKEAAVLQAADDVRNAAMLMVRDGNSRNLDDTLQALRDTGATKKDGEPAQNTKGKIYSILIESYNACHSARETFKGLFAAHKGKPTADMTSRAMSSANAIADVFEQRAREAIQPKPKAKKEPAKKQEPENKQEPKPEGKVGEKRDLDGEHEIFVSDLKEAFSPERLKTAGRIRKLRMILKAERAIVQNQEQIIALLREELAIERARNVANVAAKPAKRERMKEAA